MELQDFLAHVDNGAVIEGGSQQDRFMHDAAQEAFRITAEINTGYRTPDDIRALLGELTDKPIDDSVAVFPPFHSEFGKNLTLGRGVVINLGCRFQDTASAGRSAAVQPPSPHRRAGGAVALSGEPRRARPRCR